MSLRYYIISNCILTLLVIILFCQSILLINDKDEFNIKISLIIQTVILVLFVIIVNKIYNKLLNPPGILMFSVYLWHVPFLLGRYFEFSEIFLWSGRHLSYGSEFLPEAIAMVSFSMCAVVLGAIFGNSSASKFQNKKSIIYRHNNQEASVFINNNCRILIFLIFIFYVVIFLIYVIFEGAETFSGNYMDLYLSHSDTFLYRFFQSTKFSFIYIIISLFAIIQTKLERILYAILCFLIIIMQLMLGTRSLPFINLIALIVSIDTFVVSIPITILFSILLMLAAGSFVIEHSRISGIGFGILDFNNSNVELDVFHIFWETGGVIRNVIRTIYFMGKDGYLYGESFINTIIYLLPKPILDILGFHPQILRPSEWLVLNSGDVPYGGGLGYSLVAEAYFNFGYFGAVIFFIISFFISRQSMAYFKTKNIFYYIDAMNISIVLAFHMRNDSEAFLRYIVYGFILTAILRWVNSLPDLFSSAR